MSDDHIDKLLANDAADKELDAEIKAYEAEQAEVTEEPAPEPVEEPEVQEELELETKEETSDEEPAPEPEAEKAAEPQKQVPLTALQAERAKTQQLTQEVNQIKLYLQELQQRVVPQQDEQESVPDPDENPIEALSWLMKQQAQQVKSQQEQAEQQRQQQYQQQIQQNYAMQAQQFEAQAPDFKEAYNHLIQNRAQELALAGLPQDQIAEQINKEELNMAAHALQVGANPAQQIYEMAKLRGYAPRAHQPQQQPAVSPQARQEMEEARRAASINTNRSAPPAKGMTLEQIAELNGAAFDKALAKWERENGLGPKSII